MLALAEWVWCSLRPGEQITAADKVKEVEVIMCYCDKNENGSIGQEKFAEYYEKIAAEVFRYGDICIYVPHDTR